jgi:hypothetical protein
LLFLLCGEVITLPSKLSPKSGQTDAVDQFPFRGSATAAIGAFGVTLILPLVLAVTLGEFVDDVSLQIFVVGVLSGVVIEYILGYLTDDNGHWPTLPVWTGSNYVFTIVVVFGIVAFTITTPIGMSLLPTPPWVPAVVIGGIQAFATASATTLIFGSTRSAIWMIRQVA